MSAAPAELQKDPLSSTGGNSGHHLQDQGRNTTSSTPSQTRCWSPTDADQHFQPDSQTTTVRNPSFVAEGGDSDLPGIFDSIVEDSFATFDVDYEEDGLRELLMNAGFD